MKKNLLILVLIFFGPNLTAQENEKDSLSQLLAKEKRDTSRVMLLVELAYASLQKPDTAMYFSDYAIKLADNIKFLKGKSYALQAKGTVLVLKENSASALENYIEALKIAESINDKVLMGGANMNIGNIYSWIEEYEKSNTYFFKAKAQAEESQEKLWLANMLLNLGSNYEKLNILDSARHYIQKAYEMAIKLNYRPLTTNVLLSLGNVHSKMGLDKLAMEYYLLSFKEAEAITGAINTFDALSFINQGIAKLYEKQGISDSAFHYAKISLEINSRLNRMPMLETLQIITNYYKDHGNIDSAFNYQQKILSVKDSLFGQQKTKQIQLLSFKESQRQKQVEQDALQAEKERKNNLQVIGIGTFIITAFLFLLLLSRRKITTRVVEVFSVFLLLLVFEYIALLIHPFIERITHHTPILVFMSLVAIASVLIPLHHKMEVYIKQKLAHKISIPVSLESNPDAE